MKRLFFGLIYCFMYIKIIVMKLRAMFWCEYVSDFKPFFSPHLRTHKVFMGNIVEHEYWICHAVPYFDDEGFIKFEHSMPHIVRHPVFVQRMTPKVRRKQ